MEKNIPMSSVTPELIKELKKKHGDVFKINVEDKACIVKTPSRKSLGYASVGAKSDPVKYNEIVLNSIWLAGDEEIKTDDNLFFAVSQKLDELFEIKEASLEKL